MNPCQCTHHIAGHRGYRPGREEAERCLVEGCGCQGYQGAKKEGGETKATRATMPADFHRALNNLRQEFNKKLDALKAEYLKQ